MVKKLVKLDASQGTVSMDAATALTAATTAFVRALASEAAAVTRAMRRRTVTGPDLVSAIHRNRVLAFLRLDFPAGSGRAAPLPAKAAAVLSESGADSAAAQSVHASTSDAAAAAVAGDASSATHPHAITTAVTTNVDVSSAQAAEKGNVKEHTAPAPARGNILGLMAAAAARNPKITRPAVVTAERCLDAPSAATAEEEAAGTSAAAAVSVGAAPRASTDSKRARPARGSAAAAMPTMDRFVSRLSAEEAAAARQTELRKLAAGLDGARRTADATAPAPAAKRSRSTRSPGRAAASASTGEQAPQAGGNDEVESNDEDGDLAAIRNRHARAKKTVAPRKRK